MVIPTYQLRYNGFEILMVIRQKRRLICCLIRKDPTIRFEEVSKDVLSEKAAHHLLDLIKSKQLRPGDKLPPERELALEMKISRPVLREALRALSMMKIIESRQGNGIYVTSLKPELLVKHLDFVFSLTDSSFLSLFEARKAIETGIIEIAAQKISDEQLVKIQDCVNQSVLHKEDYEKFSLLDLELHNLIAEAAGNPILSQVMDVIIVLGKESRNRTVVIEGVTSQSIEDHKRILDALVRRDSAMARQMMLDHLNNVERSLRRTHTED